MQKKIKWVFFALTLILGTMLSNTVYASTFTYDDLPEHVKILYKRTDKFAYGIYNQQYSFVTTSNVNLSAGGTEKISGNIYRLSGEWMSDNVFKSNVNIKYSTYDIKNTDGSVFFSKTMAPIPRALSQVLPNLMSQATKILPVGLVVLSALLVVSLIPKVLYRLF